MIDLEDMKDLIKLKAMANNDHKFKRYVYNITEEEQSKYGFEFIGTYDYEPNEESYNINTTYRNSRTKSVYIKTKHGWDLFLKDGNDGRNGISGGGMGFNDVQRLITENISSIGGLSFQSSIISLDDINDTYTITHNDVDINKSIPTISLLVPNNTSEILSVSITNRTSSSFDVLLSQIPPYVGYSISWILPN